MPLNAAQAIERNYIEWLQKDEEARQAYMEARLLMYRDNWRQDLISRVNKRLCDETQAKMIHYLYPRFNPYQSIIIEISDICTDPPTRTFSVKGTAAEDLKNLYDRLQIDQKMEVINRYLHVVNDPMFYVHLREVDGEFLAQVDILTPNVVSIFTRDDDPTVPVKVMIKMRKDSSKGFTPDNRYWVVWTADEHYILDSDYTVKSVEGNEEMKNPWGRLPFVFLHKYFPDDRFWAESEGDCLYEFCIAHAISDCMDQFSRFFSGFKQGVVTGNNVTIPPGIKMSPDVMLKVEGDSVNFQAIDWQIDLAALNEDKKNNLELISQEYGIDASQYSGGQRESGVALHIRNSKLSKVRKMQQKILLQAERELFELLKIVAGIPEGVTMDIAYVEPKPYADPQAELEVQAKEIEIGLASMVDIFMKRNPDYKGSPEEALKRLLEIQEENNKIKEAQDSSLMKSLNPVPSQFQQPQGESQDDNIDDENQENKE